MKNSVSGDMAGWGVLGELGNFGIGKLENRVRSARAIQNHSGEAKEISQFQNYSDPFSASLTNSRVVLLVPL
jgi:hypothetical protein